MFCLPNPFLDYFTHIIDQANVQHKDWCVSGKANIVLILIV